MTPNIFRLLTALKPLCPAQAAGHFFCGLTADDHDALKRPLGVRSRSLRWTLAAHRPLCSRGCESVGISRLDRSPRVHSS